MICPYCEHEMTSKFSCAESPVKFPDGTSLPQIPSEYDCRDCGCPAGTFHHPGCDMERCPKCGGQLIACGCLSSDEED